MTSYSCMVSDNTDRILLMMPFPNLDSIGRISGLAFSRKILFFVTVFLCRVDCAVLFFYFFFLLGCIHLAKCVCVLYMSAPTSSQPCLPCPTQPWSPTRSPSWSVRRVDVPKIGSEVWKFGSPSRLNGFKVPGSKEGTLTHSLDSLRGPRKTRKNVGKKFR